MLRLDPIQLTPPATAAVDLATVKQHLRVDTAAEDDLIASYVEAATRHLDGFDGILGRCLVSQTWQEQFRYFGSVRIPLRLAPVLSISSVNYVDSDGETQTVASDVYRRQKRAGEFYVELVDGATWPSQIAARDDAVTITYVAGYGAASAVPPAIVQAILLITGDFYENRETVVTGTVAAAIPMSATVERLLWPFKRAGF